MTLISDTSSCHRRASWYQRLFARMLASESETTRRYYESRKRALLGDLHGDVLEIGPGTGPNLAYYPSTIHWVGLDPNPAMFSYVEQEAERLRLSIQLYEGQIEHLNLADNRFDAVVSTLVLCSVADQNQALQEIHRVLKVGGRFVFIEHVAAPLHSSQRRWQRFLRPLWKRVSEGCEPDRETWTAIETAGFSSVQLEHFRLDIPIVSPHISGIAIK